MLLLCKKNIPRLITPLMVRGLLLRIYDQINVNHHILSICQINKKCNNYLKYYDYFCLNKMASHWEKSRLSAIQKPIKKNEI